MSNVDAAPQDAAKTEAFGAEMTALLNHSFLALMISVGHRTGLFDRLATLPPSTSRQIADAAGLDERYVREWLGAMACGRIIDHDGKAGTYSLPREHAAFLTRGAGANNLATMTQFLALGGAIEDRVVACFREGGGVSYAEQESSRRFRRSSARCSPTRRSSGPCCPSPRGWWRRSSAARASSTPAAEAGTRSA